MVESFRNCKWFIYGISVLPVPSYTMVYISKGITTHKLRQYIASDPGDANVQTGNRPHLRGSFHDLGSLEDFSCVYEMWSLPQSLLHDGLDNPWLWKPMGSWKSVSVHRYRLRGSTSMGGSLSHLRWSKLHFHWGRTAPCSDTVFNKIPKITMATTWAVLDTWYLLQNNVA